MSYAFLTQVQRSNLDKLASHLERLPKRYKHFDMVAYFLTGRSGKYAPYSDRESRWQDEQLRKYTWNSTEPLNHCNTTACAVGHGPAAGLPVPRDLRKRLSTGGFTVDWDVYAGRTFTGHNKRLWEWLFSGRWAEFDNTPHGAAARIRWVLADRELPELLWDRTTKPLVSQYAEYLVPPVTA